MYCEKTSQGRYALQDLTIAELRLLQAALSSAKRLEFNNPEKHHAERRTLENLFFCITNETQPKHENSEMGRH